MYSSTLFLVLLVLLITLSTHTALAEECEVCVKIINDVRATMAPKDIKNKVKVEESLGKYCAKKELGAKEKKICYYLDP
jgi:hypothetical protein